MISGIGATGKKNGISNCVGATGIQNGGFGIGCFGRSGSNGSLLSA